MHIEASSIAGVELIGPDAPEFRPCMKSLFGGAPTAELEAALPYSVIVRNSGDRPIVLLGVRFDMVSNHNKPYSVVHYADTLRYPEKPSLMPGGIRFVCAEPSYTNLVLRQEFSPDRRAAMNLENLASALRMTASLDCAAFADGQFAGPDSHGAFDRFMRDREAESALIEEVLQAGPAVEALLTKAVGVPGEQDPAVMARRNLAKQFLAALALGELEARVRSHRVRMRLWKA